MKKAEKGSSKVNGKIKKADRKLIRYQEQLQNTSDPQQRTNLEAQLSELKTERKALTEQLNSYAEPMTVNQKLVNTLEPKVKKLEQELAEARLLFIEARDKVKSYN